MPSVCLNEWTDVRLASSWAVRRIVFTFGIQEFIHARSVPDESEHFSYRIRALQTSPKIQNVDFLENVSNEFDLVSATYEDHVSK
jgi:hypothetical protein